MDQDKEEKNLGVQRGESKAPSELSADWSTKLRKILEAMRKPPLILEGDSPVDVAGWFIAEIDKALALFPASPRLIGKAPGTFKPAPSFQPPETCPDCAAGVPFGPDGHHVNRNDARFK